MQHELAAMVRQVQVRREVQAPAPATARRRLVVQAKLALLIAEAMSLLAEGPDLIKPFLDQFKSIRDERMPPNAAMVRTARQAVLELAADRLDDLESSGHLSIDYTDRERLDQLQLTAAEWDFIKAVILPDLFAERPKPSDPVASAPGSPDRIDEMAARLEAGEDLYHPEDAKVEGRRLKTAQRMNGAKDVNGDGLQVLGWG